MEFRDLKTQYKLHKESIDSAVLKAVSDAHFIGGEQVAILEKRLAEYVGARHCISCANGTDALQLALMAWGIGENDAVFVPDFTFFSSGEVVPLVGAGPIFVDVLPETFNISAQSLEEAIKYVLENTNLNPRVVVAVDLFGQPADYASIKKIAEKYNLLILEDAAQGFGGRIGDGKACSFGDISTTSFFPAKPLGCYGDGGAIFTDNDEWADILKSLKVHGKGADKYDNVRIGMNSRLDTIQAAILLEKLNFFDEEILLCDKNSKIYNEKLNENEQLADILKTPTVLPAFHSSWAQYTVCFKNTDLRTEAMGLLNKNEIPSMIYYKKPMHKQEAFKDYENMQPSLKEKDFYYNAEKISQTCLSLPMSAYLTEEDIERIVLFMSGL